jgi:hypothetical protein
MLIPSLLHRPQHSSQAFYQRDVKARGVRTAALRFLRSLGSCHDEACAFPAEVAPLNQALRRRHPSVPSVAGIGESSHCAFPLDSLSSLRQAGTRVKRLGWEERAMGEILPISAGILVGLTCWRIASVRLRTAALVVLSVLFGALASLVNGELALSWGFLLIDIPLVFLVAVGTSLLVSRLVSARQAARR